jgi:Glyoxalase-like domain
MAFQAVDRYVAPRWPDPAHPQQFHLDFHVQELGRTHSTVLALGGRLLESARGWRVYADPAGHPFCLVGSLRTDTTLRTKLRNLPDLPRVGVWLGRLGLGRLRG